MLPAALQQELEAVLGDRITAARAVGGGCISNATRLNMHGGTSVFLKWGSDPALFRAEAAALRQLAAAQALRVPAVIAAGDWLLLEWLEPGRMTRERWEGLGRGLAGLHRPRHPQFGWSAANFIGSLPQTNAWSDDWPSFWREQRIVPQMLNLRAEPARRIGTLLDHSEQILHAGNEDGPSLLHGDLWSGNVHAVSAGAPAVIDPASYYGHREVDLAMAKLFGGFDRRFFDAYEEAWPLSAGSEERQHCYQLYYLLVHVNLFGNSYMPRTLAALEALGF
ncbi:MAG: fructosamine kinase family protein [Gemmatimonadota bacterium]